MHEVEASDTERGMKRPLNEEDQSEEEVNTSKKQRATDNKPPWQLTYKPIKLDKEEDDKLIQDMLNHPLLGYFYYKNICQQFSKLIRLFFSHSGLRLKESFVRYVKFIDWHEFAETNLLIRPERNEWSTVAGSLDFPKIIKKTIKYRHVLVDLLNILYKGYKEGLKASEDLLLKRLVMFQDRLTKQNKYKSNAYYKLLCKEFTEYFDMNTGFGNSLNLQTKRESIYIRGAELTNEENRSSLQWTPEEKDIFYEALGRYGIHRVEEIAKLLPKKSSVDVMNLYNILSRELKRCKSDEKLNKKLLKQEDFPIAYEMSDDYIQYEENLASTFESLENSQFNNNLGVYRGKLIKYFRDRYSSLFIKKDFESMMKIINGLNNDEIMARSINQLAYAELYNLVVDYLTELMRRLYVKKLNELSVSQTYEWYSFIRTVRKPKDPKSMVNIIDPKNINREVKEDIDYFNSSNCETDDSSDEDNNFFPILRGRKKDIHRMTDKDITIKDKNDIYKIAITKDDVYELTNEMLREYNCSDELLKKIEGRIPLVQDTERKPKKRNTVAETISESIAGENMVEDVEMNEDTDMESSSDEIDSSDIDGSDSDESDHDDNEALDIETILKNTEKIEDIQPEGEFENFSEIKSDDEHLDFNGGEDVVEDDGFNWYDDEFIVPDDSDEDNTVGLDLTTRGHEYLQRQFEVETSRCDSKDIKDSILHENLLLTHLTTEKDDNYNDDEYVDLLSTIHYGDSDFGEDPWKTEKGGFTLDTRIIEKNIMPMKEQLNQVLNK